MWHVQSIVMLVLLAAAPAPATGTTPPRPPAPAGQVRGSLPLDGYYRVGRTMPVRIAAPTGGPGYMSVELSAAGALPVSQYWSNEEIVLPVLVLRPGLGPLSVRDQSGNPQTIDHPLRLLGDDDRLVGVAAGDAPDAVAALFAAGANVIRVPLDPANPLPGPAMAWGALDAVVIDAAAAERLGDAGLTELLTNGTAVISTNGPGSRSAWPWERIGGAWVLRHDPAGPAGGIAPDAYLSAAGWGLGWPPTVRGQAVVRGVLFVILALAALLWRSRGAVVVMIALVVVFMGLVHVWWSRLPGVRQAYGTVVTRGGGATLEQEDGWHYVVAARDASPDLYPDHRPVFASADHAERLGVRFVCQSPGQVWVQCRLPRGAALASVHRRLVLPKARPAATTPVMSPLYPMARSLYEVAGARVAGEWVWYDVDPSQHDAWHEDAWPTVVVERAHKNAASTQPSPR